MEAMLIRIGPRFCGELVGFCLANMKSGSPSGRRIIGACCISFGNMPLARKMHKWFRRFRQAVWKARGYVHLGVLVVDLVDVKAGVGANPAPSGV